MSKSRDNFWTKVVGGLLAVILLLYFFSFQVEAGNVGVVYFFGEHSRTETESGFHFKLPYPFNRVSYLPGKERIRIFDTLKQECLTKDKTNLVLTITTGWAISEPDVFISKLKSVKEAENDLAERVESARNKALQNYSLRDLVNTDFKKQQESFSGFEGLIKSILQQDIEGSNLGISVVYLGIKQMGFPADVTESVFERMKKERAEASRAFIAEGQKEADITISKAEASAKKTLADARAKSEIIRGQGDAEAAKHYAVFKKNPGLANYLRSIKTLQRALSNKKATVVLSTKAVPFRLLEEVSLPDLTQPETDK